MWMYLAISNSPVPKRAYRLRLEHLAPAQSARPRSLEFGNHNDTP